MTLVLPPNFRVLNDPKFSKLSKIDVASEIQANTPWLNQLLTKVDQTAVRLALIKGKFPWHQHSHHDEFFFVLDGEIVLEIEGCKSMKLLPHQGCTVTKGMKHRTRSRGISALLVVESADANVTGDVA